MDIPSVQIDGNDVLAVHAAAGTLVREVRGGGGPRLLHALTYRVKGHVSVDPAAYRDAGELKAALETDPIARARRHCLAVSGIGERELDAIEREAAEEVAAALAAADAAPWPDASAAFSDVQTTGAGQWR
jgi:acetoin:2,6-dichlorophenolindophenol oxidoreductase subunit alpha